MKSNKDTTAIGLGSWRFNDKTIHSTITGFTGNCMCVYDDNCMNEMIMYFGYRPNKDNAFEIVDSPLNMKVGRTVCINIFFEDKTQWQAMGGSNEKLHLKILNTGQIRLSFSDIKMQNVGSSSKKILLCSGTIQEENNYLEEYRKMIVKKLLFSSNRPRIGGLR